MVGHDKNKEVCRAARAGDKTLGQTQIALQKSQELVDHH